MKRNDPHSKLVPNMGKIVSDILDHKHMTHARLAKMLGWSETAIFKLLAKSNWNMVELQEVGKAIGEDLYDLCKAAPTEPMLPASQVEEGLKREAKLEEKIKKLEESEKTMKTKYQTALEVIEAMKK